MKKVWKFLAGMASFVATLAFPVYVGLALWDKSITDARIAFVLIVSALAASSL